MSREGAVTLRVPRWAERFTVVKAAMAQFSGEHAEEDGLSLAKFEKVLRFSCEQGDDELGALEAFLEDAKIAHDTETIRWSDEAEITTLERDRWKEEEVHSEFGNHLSPIRREWKSDLSSRVDALELHRLMLADGVEAVRRRLMDIADECGANQQALDAIAPPNDVLMFTMCLWSHDYAVLRELAESQPSLVHEPMRHMQFGQIPLNWAVENNHLELVGELLRLGASVNRRSSFSRESALDVVQRPLSPPDDEVRSLILAAGAREAAQQALAEMARPRHAHTPAANANPSAATSFRP